MKTKTKFLMYAMIALAITVTCCSKEGDIGPMGPQGEQGLVGPEGLQGSPGQDGEAQGIPGEQGEQGPKGDSGEDGQDGEDGVDGQDGAQGPKGLRGEPGPRGEQGLQGTTGQDGNANVQAFTFDVSKESGNTWILPVAQITREVLDNDVILAYLTYEARHHQVPGKGYLLGLEVGRFDGVGETRFEFFNSAGYRYDIEAGLYDTAKIIIIKSSMIGKSSSLNKLKSAGIDTSNYQEVADYFGLDY